MSYYIALIKTTGIKIMLYETYEILVLTINIKCNHCHNV